MSEEESSQSQHRPSRALQPMRRQPLETLTTAICREEGEELSGCLKLSSPLANPQQGFRSPALFYINPLWQSWSIKLLESVTSLMLEASCDNCDNCDMRFEMWDVRTLARQTRAGVTLTSRPQYAGASQPSQLAPVWITESLSLSEFTPVHCPQCLNSQLLVCLCI